MKSYLLNLPKPRSVLGFILVVPLVIFISACGDSDSSLSSKKISDAEKRARYIAIHQERIIGLLKDPGSAQFRNVFVTNTFYASEDTPVVCGEVNAKNSFGGYIGFRRFVSHGSVLIIEKDDDGELDKKWAQDCK